MQLHSQVAFLGAKFQPLIVSPVGLTAPGGLTLGSTHVSSLHCFKLFNVWNAFCGVHLGVLQSRHAVSCGFQAYRRNVTYYKLTRPLDLFLFDSSCSLCKQIYFRLDGKQVMSAGEAKKNMITKGKRTAVKTVTGPDCVTEKCVLFFYCYGYVSVWCV